MSLIDDLKSHKTTLDEFKEITTRSLNYFKEIITKRVTKGDYIIGSSLSAGTTKYIRPINTKLFLFEENDFIKNFDLFSKILDRLKAGERKFTKLEYEIVDKVSYTILQSTGLGFDLLGESNSARKHVGNRFEEFIKALFSYLNISSKKIILKIPYKTESGTRYYRCETEIVLSPHDSVKSTSSNIHRDEIVVSLKTTTKDRMSKIFIDKILMERFVRNPVRVVGISINDVQRKNTDQIATTFVSNLFMVYTEFLTNLDGYYYIDIPVKATSSPFTNHIFPFSKLIIQDIWKLIRITS